MCGRYNLRTSAADLVELFGALPFAGFDLGSVKPRYNIAPTQTVVVIRQDEASRVLLGMRWGLVPFWAKDLSIGNRLINARGETVASKPAFRAAFKRRRCLIPADGFYEWKKLDARHKQPYHIESADGEPLALAGLWECWHDAAGNSNETCTIITTTPNDLMAELHDRMPVILDESAFESWLDTSNQDVDSLQRLIGPCPSERLRFYPVSTAVNSPRHDAADCIDPLDAVAE